MVKKAVAFLAVIFAIACSNGTGVPSTSDEPIGTSRQALANGANRNAAYLDHAYVSGSPNIGLTQNILGNAAALKLNYFFVNVGKFDDTGRIQTSDIHLTDIRNFLTTLAGGGVTDIVAVAWLNASGVNGTGPSGTGPWLDYPAHVYVRQNMVNECQKYVLYDEELASMGLGTGYLGSIVGAANDPNPTYGGTVRFHGCLWDLEYNGAYNSLTVSNITSTVLLAKQTMALTPSYSFETIAYGLKTTSGGLPDSTWWTPSNMNTMASSVTGFASSGYDYNLKCTVQGACSYSCNAAQNQYCAYMQVQGAYYAAVPSSYPGVKIWHGLPGFRSCATPLCQQTPCAHDPRVETVARAASCLWTGIGGVSSNGTTGAAMYSHLDGVDTGSDPSSAQYGTTSRYKDWTQYCNSWTLQNCDSVH